MTSSRTIGLITWEVLTTLLWQQLDATFCDSDYTQSSHVLSDHVMHTFLGTSYKACVNKCGATPSCHSLNMYTNTGQCELNNATHLSHPGDLVSTPPHAEYRMYSLHPMAFCSNQFCSDPDVCLMNRDGMNYRCRKCSNPLGMEDGRISNSRISASSIYMVNHEAANGRLNTALAGGWASKTVVAGEYLQIDLGRVQTISKVATQGRHVWDQWVTKYSLAYSLDGTNWSPYKDRQYGKEFQGNSDMHTVVTHKLPLSIKTRYIRFVVLAWKGHIAMRAELYGCTAP